jgi:serine/threonine protein kinase
VADFGLTRVMVGADDYQPRDHQARLPIKWLAPEAAHYNRFSTKSDVWAFGIVLMEIITRGRVPYPGMSNTEVLEKTSKGYRMPKPIDCPEHVYNIMLECWQSQPEKRPTFETLMWQLEDGAPESGYREAEMFMR